MRARCADVSRSVLRGTAASSSRDAPTTMPEPALTSDAVECVDDLETVHLQRKKTIFVYSDFLSYKFFVNK